MTPVVKIIESCGNVFEDLGLDNPKEKLIKAQICYKIVQALNTRKLKQNDAAKILKISQPKVSLLINGKLSGFSLEKLIELLELLGGDVTISATLKTNNAEKFVRTSTFQFPVPSPKHPLLAASMPRWDYMTDFCLSQAH